MDILLACTESSSSDSSPVDGLGGGGAGRPDDACQFKFHSLTTKATCNSPPGIGGGEAGCSAGTWGGGTGRDPGTGGAGAECPHVVSQ